ncbi:extended synaptotagmin-1, partial [Elysia marginata]
VNVGFDLVVEDLTVAGTLQAIICLSMDNPFPHVNKATICFKEKPDVTFNIRMLRALSLMEIPLLKSWIHNNVMEGLTKAMVDPASVDINVSKVGPTLMGQNVTQRKKGKYTSFSFTPKLVNQSLTLTRLEE